MCRPTDHIAVEKLKYAIEYARRNDQSLPARRFLEDELQEKTQLRLIALFRHIAATWPEDHFAFRDERKPFRAFVANERKLMIRMPCFLLKDRWIITHGFWKPNQAEWPEEQIKLAEEIMKEVKSREPQ